MVFLHPVFTITTLVLIGYSFLEVYNNRSYKSVWVFIWILVVMIGLRAWVGADYPIYLRSYNFYGERVSYSDIFENALGRGDGLEMEWLYILLGKVLYLFDMPFFIFTLFVAVISITIKYRVFDKNVLYGALAMLLYLHPTLYTSDGGHMRQGLSMAMVLFSFEYIKKRNLLMFMFIMYIAIGFHKSVTLFIPMYWLVRIPLNSTRILLLVLVCMALSPLKVYQYIALLDTLAPEEVYSGFQSYESVDIDVTSGFIKLNDLICIFYTYFLVTYDKEASERIPYYEYMRNIVVVGICMYFIFRWNNIFSSRLVSNFLIYTPIVLASIVVAVKNEMLKKSLHLVLIGFVVFYYFVYGSMQADRARYTVDKYQNYLWFE